MGDIRGFLQVQREDVHKRPASERVNDYREFELPVPEPVLRAQASRCMDCGIPFCHGGCPLGNLIPDFNDHVYKDRLEAALGSLHATNNFPEFTGRVCPAPCEASCVLNLEEHPVTIKNVERAIVDRAWEKGLVQPSGATLRNGQARGGGWLGACWSRGRAATRAPRPCRHCIRARRSNRGPSSVRDP